MENKIHEKSNEREKCFVMMPISDQGDYPNGHFQKVYEQIFRPAIEDAGYVPYRVDENTISDSIIDKIFLAIQECPMALCDLSNRNPNVLYELGIRQAYDKPVVLVQDEKTNRIFDVSGISTVEYKSQRLYEDVLEARERITKSIVETREGKRNTIVKIVRAKTAELPAGDVSKEDKVEIMLSMIANDLKELKSERNYNIQKITNMSSVVSSGEDFEGNTTRRKSKIKYLMDLKQGVTNLQISHEIGKLEKMFDCVMRYRRTGDLLYLELYNVSYALLNSIVEELKYRIGK